MTHNPILEEIRRYRDEHAREFDYDLDAIFDDLKKKQQQAGRRTVTREPRRPNRAQAAR